MNLWRRVPLTLRVFGLAFIGYAISAQVWAKPISIAPHYVYLAQSFLRGHVDLIQLPPTTYDLLQHNGQWFVAGSPLPSILMLPFVALFGVNFSDVLFSIVIGALDVALVYDLLSLLRRTSATNSFELTESARHWLTILFAIGTPFWYLAALGTYWFTAHVVTVLFALLAVREAVTRRRWFLAGIWLSCASLARPTALAMTPFFLVMLVHSSFVTRQVRLLPRHVFALTAALLIGLAAHGAYNAVRFGSVRDFGYGYVAGAPNLTENYNRYGGFSMRFLPCNLSVSLLSPPQVNGRIPDFISQTCSYLLEVDIAERSTPIAPNPLGMSVFIVTPALLMIFSARRRNPIVLAAWSGLLTTMVALWLYHNTGSLQFGYRYVFDAAPMWLILLVYGADNLTRIKRGLILVSIAINLWGLLWMFAKIVGRQWF